MKSLRESFYTSILKSSSKNSQTRLITFTQKINSIKQYLQVCQQNPEKANKWQLKQQSLIYHNQLKVSLHLILSLIKICESKQVDVRKKIEEICFLRQKMHQLQVKKENGSQIVHNNENFSGQLNKSPNTPVKRNNLALQAQKMLISAKHNQQTSEYKKIISKKEQLLKNTTEENQFLRQQLLAITSKVAQLQQKNQQLKKLNSHLQKENNNLNSKLNQNQHCRVLNFSPISKTSEQAVDQEISFNHLTFADKEDEYIALKNQKEYLQLQINRIKNQDLQKKVIPCSIQEYQLLKKEYEQLKNQMNLKMVQIQKYRQLQSQISQIEKLSTEYIQENKYLKEQIKILKLNLLSSKQLENQNNKDRKCDKCADYEVQVQRLIQELQVSEGKCSRLQSKIEKIISAQQNQRKLWDQIFKINEELSF